MLNKTEVRRIKAYKNKLIKTLDEMKEQILDKNDTSYAEIYAEELTIMLDKLHAEDFFGTEGQNDPRGRI